MQTCCKKIGSATQFIGFFIHDILDYTVLKEDSKNFVKNVSLFNVKNSVS